MWVKLIISLIILPSENYHPSIKSARKRLKNGLVINGFLELVLTTYLDFLMAAWLTVNFGAIDGNFQPYTFFFGEVLSLAIISYAILVGLLVIPVGSLIIIFQTKYDLNEPRIKETIGILYEDVHIRKGRWAKAYTFIFSMRRIIIIAITLTRLPIIIQCLVILFMNLFMTIYIGHDRILDQSRWEYRFGLFNEMCISLAGHYYINFAGNLDNHETEYIVGYFACFIILLIIVS